MAKVSISEAARLAGVSRQHLYKKWITPGLLTVEKDGVNLPLIDTSELLRVFGELKGEDMQAKTNAVDLTLMVEMDALRRLLADRDSQLLEAREREEWFKQHVGEVTRALRLLEDKSPSSPSDELKRLQVRLRKYQEAFQRYKEAFDGERNKGFWARVFGR